MKSTALILFLILTGPSFAQDRNIDQQIESQAQELLDILPYSQASMREKREVLGMLTRSRQILERNSDRPQPSSFFCTDRDRDNRSPFVYAYHNARYEVVRLTDVVFGSLRGCEEALEQTLRVGSLNLACADRDGDNRRPFIAFQADRLNNRVVRMEGHTFNSAQSCYNQLQSIKLTRRGDRLFCTDRDGDGRSPYIMMKIDEQGFRFSQVNTRFFSSLNECLRELEQL
jgi:hypothetical protein